MLEPRPSLLPYFSRLVPDSGLLGTKPIGVEIGEERIGGIHYLHSQYFPSKPSFAIAIISNECDYCEHVI